MPVDVVTTSNHVCGRIALVSGDVVAQLVERCSPLLESARTALPAYSLPPYSRGAAILRAVPAFDPALITFSLNRVTLYPYNALDLALAREVAPYFRVKAHVGRLHESSCFRESDRT